jgi:hypothetical protein
MKPECQKGSGFLLSATSSNKPAALPRPKTEKPPRHFCARRLLVIILFQLFSFQRFRFPLLSADLCPLISVF